jgi:hypothetical protein
MAQRKKIEGKPAKKRSGKRSAAAKTPGREIPGSIAEKKKAFFKTPKTIARLMVERRAELRPAPDPPPLPPLPPRRKRRGEGQQPED